MKKLLYIFLLPVIFATVTSVQAQKHTGKNSGIKQQKYDPSGKNMVSTAIFLEANKAKIIGDTATAIRLFNNCIQAAPDNDAAYYELASIYNDRNDPASATKLAEKAFGLDNKNPWYGLLLLDIYRQGGKNDEAVKLAQQLVHDSPENPDLLFELADIYLTQEKYGDAIKIYDKIEEKIGVTEEISVQKQKIYAAENKTGKAADEMEKLAAAFPEDSRYQALLAEMYMKAKMPDKALAAYTRLAQIDPGNPYIHISLADFYRQQGDLKRSFAELKLGFANPALDIDTKIRVMITYYTLSEKYEEMKGDAIELAQILKSTHPDDPKSHSMYADFLVRDKKFEEARAEYRKVLSLDSSKYVVWETVLQLDAQLADYSALTTESTRSIELFPLQPMLYLFNGAANIQRKKYPEAIKSLEAGSKLVTGNDALLSQFNAYLGDAYNAMENHAASDQAYEKSLKLNPKDSYVLNNYAYYLALRGKDLEKAEPMAKKACELDSLNPSNLDTYAWVLYKLGKYIQAEIVIRKALEIDLNKSAAILEHYGDILYKLRQIDKAFDYWQKAMAAGKGSEFLEKKIKEKKLYE
jgi:tetratricopeptide (TPR) repeat protein